MRVQPEETNPESAVAPDLATLETLLQSATLPEIERRERARLGGTVTSVVLVIVLGAGIMLTQAVPVMLRVYLLFGWAVVFLVVSGASPFPLLRSSPSADSDSRVDLSGVLSHVHDPRAVGILLDAEAATSGDRQLAVQLALTRLLPRVWEIEDRPWTEEQAERAYTHLDAFVKLTRFTSNPPGFSAYPLGGTWEKAKVVTDDFPELRDEYIAFLRAIIEAFAFAGDADAAPHLEAVVGAAPRTPQVGLVQAAARKALAALHARLEAEREGRTLLRPTQEPTNSLLHPARNPESAAPESLLRAGQPAEAPDEIRTDNRA